MRGHVRRRSKKSWTVVVELPRDPETGKRRQRWVTVQGTKKEAEQVLVELLVEIGGGLKGLPPGRLMVRQYLANWLQGIRGTIRSTTADSYRVAVQAFDPLIGSIPLVKLSTLDVQQAAQVLTERFSPSTTKRYLITLKTALNQAVRWGMLPRNPARGVRLPRRGLGGSPEIQAWTEEEMNRFLKSTVKCRYHSLFWLALHTGMRIGELLALRWVDLDLKNGVVYVRRTVSGKTIQAPKTVSSKRNIPIDPQTVEVMNRHRKRQVEECLRRGESWNEEMLVFTTRRGKRVDTKSTSYRFKKLTSRVGVREIVFHGLRHTHATILLRQGVNPKTVAERLGHRSVVITLDTYSHVLPDTQGEAVRVFSRIVRQPG